jgi:serine/threonine-protein kinase RsbT
MPSSCQIHVRIDSDVDIVLARQEGRALAAELKFPATDLVRIATAISELARNVLSYAQRGEIRLQAVHCAGKCGVVIVAHDEGPGIPNITQAMQDGYSTSGGLGLGLPGVRRLMDDFHITSTSGIGTTVTVTKWRP